MKRLGLEEGLKIGEPKIWKILFFYEFCKDGRMSYQSSSLSLPRGVYDPKDKEAEEEENKNSPFPLSRSCFMTSKYSSLDLAVAKSAEAWAFWARKGFETSLVEVMVLQCHVCCLKKAITLQQI